MPTQNRVDDQIRKVYSTGEGSIEALLAPLAALTKDSPSLVMGFGAAQKTVREELIPYFHVLGPTSKGIPAIRTLILAGVTGTETGGFLTGIRLLSALETRLQLAEGLEITVYPVANVEAYRQGVFLTGKQQIEGVRLWNSSPCSHVRVLENELSRYAYDLVIVLREDRFGVGLSVESWPGTADQERVLEGAFRRFAEGAAGFRWHTNPEHPLLDRTATPIPRRHNQPAEVIVGLPGTLDPMQQSDLGIQIVLSALHATRQARVEGIL